MRSGFSGHTTAEKKGHGRILSKHTDSTRMPIGILFCFQPSFKNDKKERVQKLGSTIRIKESRRNEMVGRPLKKFGAWGRSDEGKERRSSEWLEKVGRLKKFSIFSSVEKVQVEVVTFFSSKGYLSFEVLPKMYFSVKGLLQPS